VWRTVWRHSRIHIHHWTAVYRRCLSKALFIPFDFFFLYFAIRFTDFVPFTEPPPPHLTRHVFTTTLRHSVLKLFGTIVLIAAAVSTRRVLFFFFNKFVYSLFTVTVFIPASLGPIHRVTFVSSLIFFFTFNIIHALS